MTVRFDLRRVCSPAHIQKSLLLQPQPGVISHPVFAAAQTGSPCGAKVNAGSGQPERQTGKGEDRSSVTIFSQEPLMHPLIRNFFAITGIAIAAHAHAQVTFYEQEDFRGQSFKAQRLVGDFSRYGFNDRASSADVTAGRWEVCEDSRFRGRCVVLRPGRYPSLDAMGLNDRVSSVRSVNVNARIQDGRYAPEPQPEPVRDADFRRRNNERLFEAPVTLVRAVVGPPEHRCWVEREQVEPEQRNSNVPGAVVGALLGGVLGHQVGGRAGRDLATVGGAVAGAAIGAQAGRNGSPQPAQTRDVQRCRDIPNQARPEFWDVTYNFRGVDHHVQLSAPPGPSVTVNQRGEPRE